MKDGVVRVGVAVFIFKDGKFLVGQRKNSHGHNTWTVPGGHQEFGETYENTARREVKEETNLEIKNIRFGGITNDLFKKENKHYITIWVTSDWKSGKPKINEPDKYVEQKWVTFDNLPSPLFLSTENLLKSEFINSIRDTANK